MRLSNSIQARLVCICACTAIGLGLGEEAKAQSNTEQLLRGVLGAVNKAKPVEGGKQKLPELGDLVDNSAPKAPAAKPLYANKEEALNATKAGKFLMSTQISEPERDAVVSTLIRIFRTDYDVPSIPQACRVNLRSDSITILGSIVRLNLATLTDQGPDFYREDNGSNGFLQRDLKDALYQQTSEMFFQTPCDSMVMGQKQLHPYRLALVKFSQEYAKAVQFYVRSERAQRVEAYQVAQAAAQQEKQQREEEQRKVAQQREEEQRKLSQQRLEAENRRVQEEQQRRARIERARVGG
jgi:hypothetical protein